MSPAAVKRAAPFPWLKPAILMGGLMPLALLLIGAQQGTLGANPISSALNELGMLALVFLLAALACTPTKIVFNWTWPVRIRRLLGLLAFSYATLHFLTYLILDQGFALGAVFKDIAKRSFILVGFSAWLLLIPLAITSTDRMVRRLGYTRWKALHRLAYVSTMLGTIHFILRVKKDLTEPGIYFSLALLLLAIRCVDAVRTNAKKAKRDAVA